MTDTARKPRWINFGKKVSDSFDPHVAIRRREGMERELELASGGRESPSPVAGVTASRASGVHVGSSRPRPIEELGQVNVDEDSFDDLTKDLLAVRDHRDRQAFGRLFDHFAPRLKAIFLRGGLVDGTAEDLAQDVMLAVWHKAGQFDLHRAAPAAWIFGIARNRRIDLARRRPLSQVEEFFEIESLEPDAVQIIALRQETEHLNSALARLSPEQSEMLRAAYFDDISHSGISEMTGLPLGTIKSRIRLGLERLRHEMRKISQ